MVDHRRVHAHRDRAHRRIAPPGDQQSRAAEPLPRADRPAESRDQRRVTSRDRASTAPPRTPHRPRRDLGTAARAADHHQGFAGNSRPADHRLAPRNRRTTCRPGTPTPWPGCGRPGRSYSVRPTCRPTRPTRQTFNPIFGTTRNPWNTRPGRRRVIRRLRGRRGRRTDRLRRGQRPRRIHPQPGGLLRRLWTEAVVRDHPHPWARARSARLTGRAGHGNGRPVGPERRRPGAGAGRPGRPGAGTGGRLATRAARSSCGLAARIPGRRLARRRLLPDRRGGAPGPRRGRGRSGRRRGAVDAAARPCPLRTAERLAQQLIQAVFEQRLSRAGIPPTPTRARPAARDDDSPPVRHARNVTSTRARPGVAPEARAQLVARCADFFTDYDVLLCPITPTTAIPHDHQPDVDARRIIVNGRPRPYGDQIPWASLSGVCGLPAVVLPAGTRPRACQSDSRSSDPLEDRTVIDFAGRIAS